MLGSEEALDGQVAPAVLYLRCCSKKWALVRRGVMSV